MIWMYQKAVNDKKWLNMIENYWKWCENMSIMVKLLEMTSFEQVSNGDESEKHL